MPHCNAATHRINVRVDLARLTLRMCNQPLQGYVDVGLLFTRNTITADFSILHARQIPAIGKFAVWHPKWIGWTVLVLVIRRGNICAQLTFVRWDQFRPMRPANPVYSLAPEPECRSIVAYPAANAVHFATLPFYPDRPHRPCTCLHPNKSEREIKEVRNFICQVERIECSRHLHNGVDATTITFPHRTESRLAANVPNCNRKRTQWIWRLCPFGACCERLLFIVTFPFEIFRILNPTVGIMSSL